MKHRITYRMEQGGAHWTLTVWLNGACMGHLCVGEKEVDVLLVITKALKGEDATEVKVR